MTHRTGAVAVTASPFQREQTTEVKGHTLKAGDPVKIINTDASRSRYLRGTWIFRALATGPTGTQWIEVHGGRPGHEMHRSFPLERIEPIRPKEQRRTTTTKE